MLIMLVIMQLLVILIIMPAIDCIGDNAAIDYVVDTV
jgi:hypothetical protein